MASAGGRSAWRPGSPGSLGTWCPLWSVLLSGHPRGDSTRLGVGGGEFVAYVACRHQAGDAPARAGVVRNLVGYERVGSHPRAWWAAHTVPSGPAKLGS